MKFKSIGNQSNLSSSRFSSLSPSMKLDSMGFSHISWITVKNGHNEINYKYWNGDEWNFIGDNSIVSKSKDSIYYSPNGIALTDEDSPIIAFARKDIDTANKICVARTSWGEWNFNELEVDYDIKWIGAFFYSPKFEWSSSSSIEVKSTSSESSSSSSIEVKSTSSISSPSSIEINSTSSISSPSSLSSNSNSSNSSDSSTILSRSSSSSGSDSSTILSRSSDSSITSNSNSSDSSNSDSSSSSIIVSRSSNSSDSKSNSSESNSSSSSVIESRSSNSSPSSNSNSSDSSTILSNSSASSNSNSSNSLSSKSSNSSDSSASDSSASGSSSSIDSSSSSSADNKDIYIVTYDGTTIRIYSLSSLWILVGQKDEEIVDFSSFKCVNVGNKIGFTYVKDENVIRYNFFDLNTYYWTFSSFKDVASSITTGKIISLGVNGFLRLETIYGGPRIYMSWIEDLSTPYIQSYVKGCYVTENEELAYWQMENSVYQNYIDLEQLTYISSISANVSASHRVIGTCAYLHNDLSGNPDYYPIIFVSGAKTSVFLNRWIVSSATTYPWKEYKVDLGYTGTAVPKNIETIFDEISGKIKVVFDDNESSIIYTENEIGLDTQTPLALENDVAFDIETPKIVVLNDAGVYISNWEDGGLQDGSNVSGVKTSSRGAILRDSVNPIVIVDDVVIEDEEDNSFSFSSSSSDQSDMSIFSESSLSSIGQCIGPNDDNISTWVPSMYPFLQSFKTGQYSLSPGDYQETISYTCSSKIYLRWVADVINLPGYPLRGHNYFLFAYMKNIDGKISATVRDNGAHPSWAGPYLGYYTDQFTYPNFEFVYSSYVPPNYPYLICPLVTPMDEPNPIGTSPWQIGGITAFTPAEAYNLKSTLDLLSLGSPYVMDNSYTYHDILKFWAIQDFYVDYYPRTDSFTSPTYYWLPHLDGLTSSEPEIYYGY